MGVGGLSPAAAWFAQRVEMSDVPVEKAGAVPGVGVSFGASRWVMLGTSSPSLPPPRAPWSCLFPSSRLCSQPQRWREWRSYQQDLCHSAHETGCAGTNTLTGICSESRVLGDNWVSWPVLGLAPALLEVRRSQCLPVPGSVQAASRLQPKEEATLPVTFRDEKETPCPRACG